MENFEGMLGSSEKEAETKCNFVNCIGILDLSGVRGCHKLRERERERVAEILQNLERQFL